MGSVFSTISSAVKTVWSGIKNVAERAYNFVSNVTTSISYVTHNAIQKATNFVTAKIGGCAITVVKAISLVSETIIQGVIGNFALVIFAASFLFDEESTPFKMSSFTNFLTAPNVFLAP